MNYRYHLLKYAGPSTRWTCPQCGRKHCFAPYVDKDNHPAGEEPPHPNFTLYIFHFTFAPAPPGVRPHTSPPHRSGA